MEEISLQELYYILKKKAWIIILFLVVAIAISAVVSFFILKPEYKTFTTLMLGKPKDYQTDEMIEYNDLLLNQKLVHTYGALVQSREVGEKVINNLNLNLSYGEFSKKVKVNLVDKTEIIKLEVVDQDPETAALIANETAEVFMDSVKKFLKVENVQVIDKAEVPTSPIKPNPKLNIAISAVLGLMLSIFVIFLMEYLDQTIKRPEDIEKYLSIPVIGAIPNTNGQNLISLEDPKSPVSEAFRTMRTNIEFSNIDDDINTIVITSSTPGEGKSTIASNLAISMAQGEKKVLIIDCDLRKPKINKIFDLPNNQGLTTVLLGNKYFEDVVNKHERLDNLYVLTSGPIPPNPAELLGSKKMGEFINELKGEFDTIIMDSPPIGLVTDGVLLSTISDGLILVTAAGDTDIDSSVRSLGLVRNVNSKILGGVLNKIPIKGNPYYKYEYYSYYGEEES